MKIEELRKIANTNPMKIVGTAVDHFDALIAVAEAAKDIQERTSVMEDAPSFTWDGWQALNMALAKLEAVE